MKRITVLMLLAAMPFLQAQEPDPGRRVFDLKYVSPGQIARLLGYKAETADDQLKILILHGPKSVMDRAEEFIKRVDVPPPPIQNVEVTIYLMSALGQPATTPVPAELEGVVKQLQGMFSYKGYQLIDTQVIRVRAGQGGQASGVVDRNAAGQPKTLSDVRFGSAKVSTDDRGRALHIDQLRVGLKLPIPPSIGDKGQPLNYATTGIFTDVDVREGQKVVVGKANMDGSDKASIVVLTAKVVE